MAGGSTGQPSSLTDGSLNARIATAGRLDLMPLFSEAERDELAEPIPDECLGCEWLDESGRCPLRACKICHFSLERA